MEEDQGKGGGGRVCGGGDEGEGDGGKSEGECEGEGEHQPFAPPISLTAIMSVIDTRLETVSIRNQDLR